MYSGEIFKNLLYGPSTTQSFVIISNDDGEGGGFDCYHGDRGEVETAAIEAVKREKESRVRRVTYWKSVGWYGMWYDKIFEFTILVIHPNESSVDMSVPEERTGLD